MNGAEHAVTWPSGIQAETMDTDGDYAVAGARGEVQWQLLDEICAAATRLDQVDLDLGARLVRERLMPAGRVTVAALGRLRTMGVRVPGESAVAHEMRSYSGIAI